MHALSILGRRPIRPGRVSSRPSSNLIHDLRHRRTIITQHIAQLALTVLDYDDAIGFYVGKLGFELLEDTDLGDGKRWVRVQPAGSSGAGLLLARAVTPEQRASVGAQTGGRVFLFIETDDFQRDYKNYVERGVKFVRQPSDEPFGTVAVFEDLYGNKIDLIQRRDTP